MRNRKHSRGWILLIACLVAGAALGQSALQLPTLPKTWSELKQSIRIDGTLSLSTSIYSVSQTEDRRPPFRLNFYGNPTVYVNDLAIPAHFSLGTYQDQFRQEFNQFGISPHYKNLRLHLGHSSVSFSPVALSGHRFLGGGVEWSPGKLRLGYVYGRFQRKILPDSVSFFKDRVTPIYSRRGMGIKAGYGTEENFLDIIVFKAKDIEKSLEQISDWVIAKPSENAVVAISSRQRLLRSLQFDFDLSYSAYTENYLDPEAERDGFSLPSLILTDRSSTQYSKALQTGLKYRSKEVTLPFGKQCVRIQDLSLDIDYERIDPGYRSMGVYFFRNDLERVRFTAGLRLFEKKLSLNLPLGLEHNDLFDTRLARNRRFIGGINLRYQPDRKLNIALLVSNFRLKLYQEVQPDEDSLVVNQVNTNYDLSGQYIPAGGRGKQRITGKIGWQKGKNISFNKPARELSRLQLGAAYHFLSQNSGITFSTGVNYYNYRYSEVKNYRLIPSVGLRRKILHNKIDAIYNLGILFSKGLTGWRNQLSLGYALNRRHNLGFQLYYLKTFSKTRPMGELQADLRWNVML